MADALCGPANPLQSFRKQTQLDRTLQQDRLIGPRHSAAQGFRTQDPRAGSLDADLHAFEHSQPSPFQFEQPSLQHAIPTPVHSGLAGGWAADFQRLHISQTPSPIPAQQFRTEAPMVRSTNGMSQGMWHDEFIRQRSSASTPISKGKQAMAHSNMDYEQSQPVYGMNQGLYMGGMGAMNGGLSQQMPQQTQADLTHHDAYNQMSEVDFENAFAEALKDAEAMQHDEMELPGQPQVEQPSDIPTDLEYSRPDVRIGSDAIRYTEKEEQTDAQDHRDADELAKTAGQLLNLVQHDGSVKFQNSQFLSLMRQLRDREVEVQNNDLQPANGLDHRDSAQVEHDRQKRLGEERQPDIESLRREVEAIRQDHGNDPTSLFTQNATLQQHDPNTFEFPNLNDVYAPSHDNPTSSSSTAPIPPSAQQYVDEYYHSGSDEYPNGSDNGFSEAFQPQAGQQQQLHPGGRWYPEMKSPRAERAEVVGGSGSGAGAITGLGAFNVTEG